MAPYAQGDSQRNDLLGSNRTAQTVTIRQSALAMVQQRLIDRAALPRESRPMASTAANTETAIRPVFSGRFGGLPKPGLPDALTVFLLLNTDA